MHLGYRPKVLVVNKLYPPWIGGVEKVAAELVDSLREEFDFTVLACRPKGGLTIEQAGGVRVIKAASLGLLFSMPLSPTFFNLYRKLSGRCDLVHFHEPFPLGTLSGLIHGFPKAIVTYHADVHHHRVLNHLYAPLQKRFLKKVDRVVATSPRLAACSPRLRGIGNRLEIIPLGIEDPQAGGGDGFQEESAEIKGPAKGRPIILSVGRLVPYKGFEVLIKALARTREGVVYIVGDGKLRSRLENLARTLDLIDRIFFWGAVSDQRLGLFYRAADIFALPSVTPGEAFGIAQVEAMAHGLPVINTSLPTGVPWVGKHRETGLTVPPGDVSALAGAIRFLVQHPEKRAELGQGGRRRYLKLFTKERMVDSVRSVYHCLIGAVSEKHKGS